MNLHFQRLPRHANVLGFHPGALALLMALLAAIPTPLLAGTYSLQRVRKATAEVVRDGNDWVVAVEFLASRPFGNAKDIEINRRLARDYAFRGLFRELGGKPENEIVVSGFQTERSEKVDDWWKARFRIPVNGVSIHSKPKPEPKPVEDSESTLDPESEELPIPDAEDPPSPTPSPEPVAEPAPEPAPEPVPETAMARTDFKVPRIAVPELKAPDIKAPELKSPELKPLVLPPPPSLGNEL